MIRCRVCGFTREPFHGWVFTLDRGRCSGETTGHRAILHDWESVEPETTEMSKRWEQDKDFLSNLGVELGAAEREEESHLRRHSSSRSADRPVRQEGKMSPRQRSRSGSTNSSAAEAPAVSVKDLEKTLIDQVGKAVTGAKRQNPAKASSNYFRLVTGEGKTIAYVNQGKKGLSIDALEGGKATKLGRVESEADIAPMVKKIEERAKALA